MEYAIFLAGFGGQGILFAGDLLAFAAMHEGYEVTWMPAYGPEMRGGTANCTVIIASEAIGAPIEAHPQALIAFSRPAYDKFAPSVAPGGLVVVNSSMVPRGGELPVQARSLWIPATDTALEMGEIRMANLVMVGAFLAAGGIMALETMEEALVKYLAAGKQQLADQGRRALRKGWELAQAAG